MAPMKMKLQNLEHHKKHFGQILNCMPTWSSSSICLNWQQHGKTLKFYCWCNVEWAPTSPSAAGTSASTAGHCLQPATATCAMEVLKFGGAEDDYDAESRDRAGSDGAGQGRRQRGWQ
jgi:hypothetical protein